MSTIYKLSGYLLRMCATQTRALYLGDSITRDWGKEEKCTKKIYDDYDKKGLNFGIGRECGPPSYDTTLLCVTGYVRVTVWLSEWLDG